VERRRANDGRLRGLDHHLRDAERDVDRVPMMIS
jgi:hypothetical protein